MKTAGLRRVTRVGQAAAGALGARAPGKPAPGEAGAVPPDAAAIAGGGRLGPITFKRLEAVSFTHSCIYIALLVAWLAFGSPEPETFALGMAHGLLWIAMSLVCAAAARARVIPFWLAVDIAVLGGLGPFAGSIGFLALERRARRSRAANRG
jgi:hypothetical protein